MITTRRFKRTFGAKPAPMVLRLVRCDDVAHIPGRHAQHPIWCWLYAMVLLGLAVLATSDYLLPDGFARSLGDVLVAFGCIGLTRLWLGANRRSLIRRADQARKADRASVNEKARQEGTSTRSVPLWGGQ